MFSFPGDDGCDGGAMVSTAGFTSATVHPAPRGCDRKRSSARRMAGVFDGATAVGVRLPAMQSQRTGSGVIEESLVLGLPEMW